MSAIVEQVEYVSIERAIPMRRVFAFPSANTFEIPPIRALVKTYLIKSKVSVDPFARNKRWATHTNDLNPDTAAESHLDSADFLESLASASVKADLVLFDPPYSPRQIKECYDGIGLKMKTEDAWRTNGWTRERKAIAAIVETGGYVISFGWNSNGMGHYAGFVPAEYLTICHGWGHNDTIVTVERKVESAQTELFQS